MIGMPSPRDGRKSSEPSRIRIQRLLADAGVASRRASEALVEDGSVTLNGKVIQSLPCFVDPDSDDIRVNGRRVEKRRRNHYIMLFKPKGYVCTAKDPQGRKLALDLVRHPSGSRLFSVGRLDLESSGLLLLTDDGELANRLTHPRYGVHKGYDVTVRGRLEDDEMEKVKRGLYLVDRKTGEATRTAESDLVILKRDRDRTRLYIALREGRNRQIRRIMDHVDHPVRKLRRVQMGPLKLKGLAVGEWRELTPGELGALRRAASGGPTASTKVGARAAGGRRKKTGGARVGGKTESARKGKKAEGGGKTESVRKIRKAESRRISRKAENARQTRKSEGGRKGGGNRRRSAGPGRS